MAKKKDKKPTAAQQLDARVRALEAHNGWTPGEVHEEDDDADTGDGHDADQTDDPTDKD